jgi:putative transposase
LGAGVAVVDHPVDVGCVDWFNNHRLHSMIGNMPPVEYETAYYRHDQPVQQPLAGEPSLH